MRLVMRSWHTHDIDPRALLTGRYAAMLANLTVVSATDGNHGKALAAAAQSIDVFLLDDDDDDAVDAMRRLAQGAGDDVATRSAICASCA